MPWREGGTLRAEHYQPFPNPKTYSIMASWSTYPNTTIGAGDKHIVTVEKPRNYATGPITGRGFEDDPWLLNYSSMDGAPNDMDPRHVATRVPDAVERWGYYRVVVNGTAKPKEKLKVRDGAGGGGSAKAGAKKPATKKIARRKK